MTAPTARETADHAELAACPFCGGKAEIVHIEEGENQGGSCVCCTACQASGNLEFGRKENFTSNWNRRRLEAALLYEIAALRGALAEAERDASSWSRCAGEVVTIGESWKERFVQAERQRDELRKALERQCDRMSFLLNRVGLHAWADKFSREVAEDRALLANQGADQ